MLIDVFKWHITRFWEFVIDSITWTLIQYSLNTEGQERDLTHPKCLNMSLEDINKANSKYYWIWEKKMNILWILCVSPHYIILWKSHLFPIIFRRFQYIWDRAFFSIPMFTDASWNHELYMKKIAILIKYNVKKIK